MGTYLDLSPLRKHMNQAELDKILTEKVDKELLKDLDYYLDIVRKNSRALASSLKRCFDNARKSERYLMVYHLGIMERCKDAPVGRLDQYLNDHLKDHFEKNDFMHYREFVRLLRACSIDLGGEVSSPIKEMYNDFFLGRRLVEAYRLGLS